jgi:hypothetical protein
MTKTPWLLFILLLVFLPKQSSAATLLQESGLSNQTAGNEPAGLYLSPEYFPLNPGNRWIYQRADSRFKSTERITVAIIGTPIIKWKTYYAFNQLPFVPGTGRLGQVLIRYDTSSRRFVRLAKEGDVPLFPVEDSSDAKVDTAVDDQGNPVPHRLSYLTCLSCAETGVEVLFDRGVGIVAVQNSFSEGTESFTLKSAFVNGKQIGDPIEEEKLEQQKKKGPAAVVSRADPDLFLEVNQRDHGVSMILHVKNPTESYLSLFFNSSQTYDFVVKEKQAATEVWRWSKSNFFSRVARNTALLPRQQLKYEEFWDYKDNQHYLLRPGIYEVTGLLSTRDPLETQPVEITIP